MMHSKELRQLMRLYWVAGTQDCHHLGGSAEDNLLFVLGQALKAGVRCYQFREKGALALSDDRRIEQLACACQALCQRFGALFIVNNDIELALRIHADGAHIGQSDTPLAQAIDLCKAKLILGVSHSNMHEVEKSLEWADGIDYMALGPIFGTISKADAATATGVQLISQARQRLIQKGIDKPLCAIGGIATHNIHDVFAAGADSAALVSAIARAPNVAGVVGELLGG